MLTAPAIDYEILYRHFRETSKPGTLFLPNHFGENPTNVLTNAEAVDPLAKIPEFKVSAVRVERIDARGV